MRKFQADKQRKLTGAEESGCDVNVTIPAYSENRKTEHEKIGKQEGRGGGVKKWNKCSGARWECSGK